MLKDVIIRLTKEYSKEQPLAAIESLNGEDWTTDYRAATLEAHDGSLGDAQQIMDRYNMVGAYHPQQIWYGEGIRFIIKTHASGFWVAMPLLPFVNCFGQNSILYFGEGFDCQSQLIKATARMCGVEPNDDIIRHMDMASSYH